MATFSQATTELRLHRLSGLARLETWCADREVSDALVAGFYVRSTGPAHEPEPTGSPLGELWLAGEMQPFVPFLAPWSARRACVSVTSGKVRIDGRHHFPDRPPGDLLQAGPLLVSRGQVIRGDTEGFSEGAAQFDSDITVGRHPRAALGHDGKRLIALACEGRAADEAGLTLDELAVTMAGLGAHQAINLDGGGSTSLVFGGRLANTPREAHETTIPGGRAIATAFEFAAH